MHCRRYFALAFFVNDIANMSEDQIMELPETKALLLIREIYHEENQLKNMTADDRLKARRESVEPKVDAFFKYIHELDLSGEVFPDKLNKAIKYAINQEDCLRRFLSDGNIPCDNGNSERLIRSYSVGRANWLFADTVRGAEVLALMYTVVETAKANQANVYTYIKYLLENIPRHLDDAGNLVDRAFLPDMVPWSNAYHKYELESRENARQLCGCLFPVATAPKAPGKAKAVPKDAWENTA